MNERVLLSFGERLRACLILVLLPLAILQWLPLEGFTLTVQLPGFYLAQSVGLRTVGVLLAAGMAAIGMDWLIRSHPSGKRNTLPHLLLPFLTTLAIGNILPFTPQGELWWVAFLFGALLLALVFLAEFQALDPSTPFFPLTAGGLTLLGGVLFLLVASSLRFVGMRLILLLPMLGILAFLLALRLFHLYLPQQWEIYWSAGIALLILELAAPLHYWPVGVVSFGLMLTGPFYALFLVAIAAMEGNLRRWNVIEAALLVLASWGMALWLSR